MTRDGILDGPRVTAEDDTALRTLIARYAHAADAGELDRFVALFTEDGSWTRENSPPASQGGSGLPQETKRGPEALRQMIQSSIIDSFNRRFRHQMTDIVITAGADADTAHGISRALITDWREGAGRMAMMGHYTWRFRRVDGDWRIASASVRVLPE